MLNNWLLWFSRDWYCHNTKHNRLSMKKDFILEGWVGVLILRYSLSSSSFINHSFLIIPFSFLLPTFFHSLTKCIFLCEKKLNKKSTLPSGSHLSLIPFPLPHSSNKPPVDCNHTPVCSDACLSRQPTARPILTLPMKPLVLMAVECSTSYP